MTFMIFMNHLELVLKSIHFLFFTSITFVSDTFSNKTFIQNTRSISKLLDMHVFQDLECKIGSAILELGRVDTLVLTLSKNQGINDLHQIPDNRGSTLYRLLTDPDNVNLEYLSTDLFMVSKS